jgi:hypothetical protein
VTAPVVAIDLNESSNSTTAVGPAAVTKATESSVGCGGGGAAAVAAVGTLHVGSSSPADGHDRKRAREEAEIILLD